MHYYLPAWPVAIPRTFKPAASLKLSRRGRTTDTLDEIALRHAQRVMDLQESIRCSGITGTWTELMFSNTSDYAALASSAVEASLLTPGPKMQPVVPALFFDGNKGVGRGMVIVARGVLSNTGTPTMTFQVRLGTTAGASQLGGTPVAVSAAITTASGVTNKFWEMRVELICNTPGQGTGNTVLNCAGYVTSPGGFGSPFTYAMEPTTPDTATWTATIDNTVTQYINITETWSASSASNTLTLKQLFVYGLN